jgi:catechol 2,3-dioxygenase-like lactoylglutathione lyase family enzyme
MELRSIDHVQVAGPPGCEAAARAFYGALLGLREIPKPPELAARGGVWFRLGQQELHVGIEEDFRPALKAHPAFRCVDPDALATSLEASGAPVTWDGHVAGVRRFYTADPFGNRLEIVGVPLKSAF